MWACRAAHTEYLLCREETTHARERMSNIFMVQVLTSWSTHLCYYVCCEWLVAGGWWWVWHC